MAIKSRETGKVGFVGRVLAITDEYERFNEMTVRMAQVLDNTGRLERVCLGSKFAEGSWYEKHLDEADVDATDEVIEAAIAIYAADDLKRRAADAIDEARKIHRGVEVEVVAGRKIALGTRAQVFWAGETKYGYRVGLTLADGSQEWTAEHNVAATEEWISDHMPEWSALEAEALAWAKQCFKSVSTIPAQERASRARRFDDRFVHQMVEAIERAGAEAVTVSFEPACAQCGNASATHDLTTAPLCTSCWERKVQDERTKCLHCGASVERNPNSGRFPGVCEVCAERMLTLERNDGETLEAYGEEALKAVADALQVLVLDRKTRAYLEMYDPQALKQAVAALEGIGRQHTPVEVK